jgi:hypothetical protein
MEFRLVYYTALDVSDIQGSESRRLPITLRHPLAAKHVAIIEVGVFAPTHQAQEFLPENQLHRPIVGYEVEARALHFARKSSHPF